MVGDEVTVTVLGVKGNQVRLGVNAPKDVAVHREEIYQRIQSEKSDDLVNKEQFCSLNWALFLYNAALFGEVGEWLKPHPC